MADIQLKNTNYARSSRLKRAMQAALVSNLVINPVYAGSASFAQVSAVPAQATKSYPAATSQSLMKFTKAKPNISSNSIVNPVTTINKTGNVYMRNAVEVHTDSPTLCFQFRRQSGTKVRVAVNNQYVAKDAVAFSTVDATYNYLSFTSLTPGDLVRVEISLESGNTGYPVFDGIFVEPLRRIWAPSTKIRASIVSDSFGAGSSTLFKHDACGDIYGHLMGWDDCWPQSQPGTGYTTEGGSNGMLPVNRIAADFALMPSAPDVIAFPLGLNDDNSPSTYTASVTAALQQARALAPNAFILALGVWHTPTNGPLNGSFVSTYSIAAENKIANAVSGLADPMMAMVRQVTDASGSWCSGDGRLGTTTGNGNSDIYTQGDGTHPTDNADDKLSGHYYLATRMAAATRAVIDAL